MAENQTDENLAQRVRELEQEIKRLHKPPEETSVSGTVTDISGQKDIEKALLNAKKQWEATFDAISDWVSIIDKDHTIIRSNNASKTFVNLEPKQVVGKHCYEIVHGIDFPFADCPLKKAVNERRPDFMEFQAEDGRWLQVTVDPFINDSREALFVHIVRDISEIKRAELEKADLEQQKRQFLKSESLARMAGAIAHHFNNQLNVIMGNLEIAMDILKKDSETGKNMAEAMQATHRCSEISRLMLTYLGQKTGRREPIDLSEICNTNLPDLKNEIPDNIDFNTDLPIPGPVVFADANQIRQILFHLVVNGAEAIGNQRGKIVLSTKIIQASDIFHAHIVTMDWKPNHDLYALLEVTDTGCGINEQDMENIFDPYFTTKFTGRGMGLAIALGIVKAMDGTITVESVKEKGSTFRVLLPLKKDL